MLVVPVRGTGGSSDGGVDGGTGGLTGGPDGGSGAPGTGASDVQGSCSSAGGGTVALLGLLLTTLAFTRRCV